jgi:lipopolysaccharide/colanic/teichoic acid biosynthesis glycosyltransferase
MWQQREHEECIGAIRKQERADAALESNKRVYGRAFDMQGAVSTAFELPTTRRRRSNRPDRVSGSDISSAIEITRELQPLSLADLEAAVETYEEVLPAERSERMSRFANIVIALVAGILLAPVYLLIALAVKLTSSGPVFYSQVRVGVDRRYREKSSNDRRGYDHGGKPFMMYKFRTMQQDAEADGRAVWAAKSDPRVTSIGRLMRRTRLDELPQLYNVLRGDMNIVGPRPERPTIFADLRRNIPEYPMRQRVKPGITGWAQINQAYDACVDDVRRKVQYDLEYMKKQSLAHDLRIMTMTLPVMIFRRGSR